MVTIPFKPRRFRSTAEYYARYRVPYPAELIEAVATRVGLKPGDRVLDLGSGPAMLAIGFAKLGMSATAMDPEPEMLDAARSGVAEAGVDVEVVQGSSYDLGPHLGRFKLVTMGRSFHWMDRPATLVALDGLIEPGGAVALFHDRRIRSSGDWQGVLNKAAEQYARSGGDGRSAHHSPDWAPHEVMLVDSPFPRIETMGRVFKQSLGVEDILGRAYSMSASSIETLGDNHPAFEAAVREALAAISPEGRFTEIVETEAMMAFRVADAAARVGREADA
jgi:SAM-dependent methyltransferase